MKTKQWYKILVDGHEMIERAMDVFKQEIGKLPAEFPDKFTLKRTDE